MKLVVGGAGARQHVLARVLAMDVHDAADVAPEKRDRIAAREDAMAAIVEQADGAAGMRHQPVDLGLGLDERAHVVVEGHADAELGHALGERGEFPAVVRPVASARRGRFEIGAKRSPSERPDVSA